MIFLLGFDKIPVKHFLFMVPYVKNTVLKIKINNPLRFYFYSCIKTAQALKLSVSCIKCIKLAFRNTYVDSMKCSSL